MIKLQRQGFTLVELIIVVVIIGILAGVSIPLYNKTREHALGLQAIANLRLIIAAEKVYRLEDSTATANGGPQFITCQCNDQASCNGAAGCNTLLRLDLNTRNWRYGIWAWRQWPTGSGFWVNATRNTTVTPFLACSYTYGSWSADEEPVPSGWLPGACP